MTNSQPPFKPSKPQHSSAIAPVDEIAVHLSKHVTPADSADNLPSLPEYLSLSLAATTPVDQANTDESGRASVAGNDRTQRMVAKLREFGSAIRGLTESRFTHSKNVSSESRRRFSSDPRDDVRLKWADESNPWWHFDVEARMVERETLWITEKLAELFQIHLKPVWWDRFVEGVHDFLSMIANELIRPVWRFFTAPIAAMINFLGGLDWPWNFELRGPNVSYRQSPLRRLVFDNRLEPSVVERLWNDPDELLDAGQTVAQHDYGSVARVPVQALESNGQLLKSSVGLFHRFNLRSMPHTLSRLLLFTRASRAWTYGRELHAFGIGVARPLAMVEDRIGPLRFRSFVLTEAVEGMPLPEFLETTPLNSGELDQLARQFARIWHTLGERRIVHGALTASNFLVTPERQLRLLNLDSCWRHWFDVTYLHRRDCDWLRFMKSWRGDPRISAAFRAAVACYFDETVAVRDIRQQRPAMQFQRAA
jgi:hypothetical protein